MGPEGVKKGGLPASRPPAVGGTPGAGTDAVCGLRRWAFVAVLLIEVVESVASVVQSEASLRTQVAVLSAGWVLLCGVAGYGAVQKARWGFWLAGILAVLLLLSTPATLDGPVVVGSLPVVESPLSVTLAWLKMGACTLFLLALALCRGLGLAASEPGARRG